ncbi:MAG: oligosaccharide flippase family protein [Candidatus Binataceae bacterium]
MTCGAAHTRENAPSPPGSQRLWRAFARSVLFNLQAELAANLIRVGGVVFLARALQPGDFGLLRILIVVGAVAALTSTAGFPEAVIQRKQLLSEHQTTAWWLTVACAGATAAMLFACASWIERLMAMVHLGAMIRLLCVPIFIEGTSAVPNALLQRQLRYGALAAADVIAEFGFVVSALVLLYLGFPRFSLPCGLAARATLRGATIWIAARFVPRGVPRIHAAQDLWPFAAGVLGGQMLVILSQNADYLMVGRLLGSRVLGFYSMAWDLLRFIPERLYRVVGRVTVPAFSAIQERQDELARHYRALIVMIGRLLLPAMALLAVAAPRLIVAIYGAKWLPVATPLRLLTVGLTMVGLRLGIGSIYYAKGWPALDIVLHGFRLIAIIAAITWLAPLGLAAVCAGMSGVESLVSIAGQWMVCRLIEIGMPSLAAATLPGLRTALWCSIAALAGAASGDLLGTSGLLTLGLTLAAGATVFCWRERATAVSLLRGTDLVSTTAEAFGG